MKRIFFINPTAQKIYDAYFKRVCNCINFMPVNDQHKILNQLNNHVCNALNSCLFKKEKEVLLDALDKLGIPERVFKNKIGSASK